MIMTKSAVASLLLLVAVVVSTTSAFMVPSANTRVATSVHAESVSRREFAGAVAFVAAATVGSATPAFAALSARGSNYEPKFKDVKIILDLVSVWWT